MKDAAEIGQTLRTRRRALGLSQREVAELAGTTQPRISRLERGLVGHVDVLAAVAGVLGLRLTLVDHRTGEPPQLPGRAA